LLNQTRGHKLRNDVCWLGVLKQKTRKRKWGIKQGVCEEVVLGVHFYLLREKGQQILLNSENLHIADNKLQLLKISFLKS
jgi:hypothetical protein